MQRSSFSLSLHHPGKRERLPTRCRIARGVGNGAKRLAPRAMAALVRRVDRLTAFPFPRSGNPPETGRGVPAFRFGGCFPKPSKPQR